MLVIGTPVGPQGVWGQPSWLRPGSWAPAPVVTGVPVPSTLALWWLSWGFVPGDPSHHVRCFRLSPFLGAHSPCWLGGLSYHWSFDQW